MKTSTRKAILIDLVQLQVSKEQAMDRLKEVEELVHTYGGIVVVKEWQKRFSPHVRTYIGTGKVDMLAEEAKELKANLLIINAQLKPRQLYEISETLRPVGVEVWDRIDLILKIFAKHAKTTEARLEIELASVRHMGPRIFGMGMDLSRQGGGIGSVGIGETNTERMKRHLKEKERRIKEKLKTYERGRELHRATRKRNNVKTVAIVGYTNAGKTTLLNALTGSKEYVANELFATLDTRVGKLYLPDLKRVVLLSDTIGFIKDLPPELMNAFSSTLSEAVEADVLIHVSDASDPHMFEHKQVVEEILHRLKADQSPQLLVLNKSEDISLVRRKEIEEQLEGVPHIWISAIKKQGLDLLIKALESLVRY